MKPWHRDRKRQYAVGELAYEINHEKTRERDEVPSFPRKNLIILEKNAKGHEFTFAAQGEKK